MSAKLKLVKSFSEEQYPHVIHCRINYNREKNKTDALFHEGSGYEEYKLLTMPSQKKKEITALMSVGGVQDYSILQIGNDLEVRFRNVEDRQICVAGLIPNSTYKLDVQAYDQKTSKTKLKKKARDLKDLFNAYGLSSKVEVVIDHERKVLGAQTNNGHDFVTLYGTLRKIENETKIPVLSYGKSQLQVILR